MFSLRNLLFFLIYIIKPANISVQKRQQMININRALKSIKSITLLSVFSASGKQ